MTQEMLQIMLPTLAFVSTLREGVIPWAIKIAAALGCAAGIVQIYMSKDAAMGMKTMFIAFMGIYVLLFAVTVLRNGRRKKR